jgi:hypothetical protein
MVFKYLEINFSSKKERKKNEEKNPNPYVILFLKILSFCSFEKLSIGK